ncbi:M23 family metallopeptidase [Microcoleus sp. FACHB-672]|uniref:peptidoglycan DD-metalloendopeptidase family protein n=1 Tax=Microcoleus sp. FACHB-672 TaxID=2692825 RepID=UPI00168675C4|nr:peptidoglycan DD-metalloendopeptidase family protein [Microcoleus sp. FACHB-672]
MHLRLVAISTLAVLAAQQLICNTSTSQSAAAQTSVDSSSEVATPHKSNSAFKTRITQTQTAADSRYDSINQAEPTVVFAIGTETATQITHTAEGAAILLPVTEPQTSSPAPQLASQSANSRQQRVPAARVRRVPINSQPPAASANQAKTKAGRINSRLDSLRDNVQTYRSNNGAELPPLSAPDTYLPNSPVQGYIWPAQGQLSSGYGWRWGRMHNGIDIAGPIGTPILAAATGVVTYAAWDEGGYGNLVEIQHPDGSITRYAHNDRIWVRAGQRVQQGQQISEMGSTGYSTGPHLHFELRVAGQGAVDPMAYLGNSHAYNSSQTRSNRAW